MYNTYLSIGTVLMLKGEGKKVMVIGYLGYDKTGKAADYMGVTYPEGYMKDIKMLNKIDSLMKLQLMYKDYQVKVHQLYHM